MTSSCSNAGRVDVGPSNDGRAPFWTFETVQERLIEAMLLWRRAPDRERGWLHVKAFWPEIRRFHWMTAVGGEHDHPEEQPMPRALPLTRAQVAAMNEAGDWLALVPERDRKLVALAVSALASGAKQVPWMELRRAMGVEFGAHGLRKRYSRAIAAICTSLNACNR
jgi:hypothetical protein